MRAVLRKYRLDYTDKDIINVATNYEEMVRLSGQPLSPCVLVNGVMLADVSGEEVENYMLSKGLVEPSDAADEVPLNAPCSDEEHARMQSKTIRFF